MWRNLRDAIFVGGLFCLLVSYGALLFSLASQYPAEQNNAREQTKEQGELHVVAKPEGQQIASDRKEAEKGFIGFRDVKWTDVLLAIFTGLLFWIGLRQTRHFESTERAFVSVSFRPTANRDIGTGNINHWTFTPVWANAGHTPTRNMRNHISMLVQDVELAPDWDFPNIWPARIPEAERAPTPLLIGPQGSVDGESLSVTVAEMQNIIAGTRFLYLWGWATYSDVFRSSARHVTRFAVRIVAGGDARDSNRISFTYRVLRTYNCSDEECERQGFPAGWSARIVEF